MGVQNRIADLVTDFIWKQRREKEKASHWHHVGSEQQAGRKVKARRGVIGGSGRGRKPPTVAMSA